MQPTCPVQRCHSAAYFYKDPQGSVWEDISVNFWPSLIIGLRSSVVQILTTVYSYTPGPRPNASPISTPPRAPAAGKFLLQNCTNLFRV